jgi:ABC-2 type transport system ATP-binding protein
MSSGRCRRTTPGKEPTAHAPADDRVRTLHQLTGWALQHGTVLDQLTVDRPSLEDIYLRLTDHDGPGHQTERNTR